MKGRFHVSAWIGPNGTSSTCESMYKDSVKQFVVQIKIVKLAAVQSYLLAHLSRLPVGGISILHVVQ